MKARKVKGVDPDGSLEDGLRRIVATRIEELESFGPASIDPSAVDVLHDMRIAAKRARYVLELAEPVIGRDASDGAKRARQLQDVLGEIHDCDESVPRILDTVERLRAQDTAAIHAGANGRKADLEPDALRRARNRRKYAGLESLAAYTRARREILFADFLRKWTAFEKSGVSKRLTDRTA